MQRESRPADTGIRKTCRTVLPTARERHVGDLGNVEANAEGNAIVDEYDRMLRLHGRDSIIGRALVVHEKPDTFVQPTGAAVHAWPSA